MPMIPMAGPPPAGPPQGPPPGAMPDPRLLGLLAMLHHGQPPPQQDGGLGGIDPEQAKQQVIQDIHTLIAVLPDPSEKAVAIQCLQALNQMQIRAAGGGPVPPQRGPGGPPQQPGRQIGGY